MMSALFYPAKVVKRPENLNLSEVFKIFVTPNKYYTRPKPVIARVTRHYDLYFSYYNASEGQEIIEGINFDWMQAFGGEIEIYDDWGFYCYLGTLYFPYEYRESARTQYIVDLINTVLRIDNDVSPNVDEAPKDNLSELMNWLEEEYAVPEYYWNPENDEIIESERQLVTVTKIEKRHPFAYTYRIDIEYHTRLYVDLDSVAVVVIRSDDTYKAVKEVLHRYGGEAYVFQTKKV